MLRLGTKERESCCRVTMMDHVGQNKRLELFLFRDRVVGSIDDAVIKIQFSILLEREKNESIMHRHSDVPTI